MIDIERRAFILEDVRIETRGDDEGPRITGHAALFNVLSDDLGGFRERIAPGAFKRAIAEDDVRALVNHNPDLVLGRNRAGTLALEEDDRGLAITIDPPDTQAARDLMTLMGREDVNQMSFGFRVRPGGESWTDDEDGQVIRTLTSVRLFDVSPVTFPAYPETDVAVRSLAAWRADQEPPAPWRRNLARRRLALAGTETGVR